ncbi:Carbamoyltransferase HypF [subsurface metagenome]
MVPVMGLMVIFGGGEFLVADYRGFARIGHLEYLPLPGGDLAIRRPYRTAIGYILALLGETAIKQELPFLKQIDRIEIDIIQKQIEQRINSPLTSSCGRLFDAVSALIGVRGEVEYEAQAAIELEMLAYDEGAETDHYPFFIVEQDGQSVIKLEDLFSAIIRDLQGDTSQARIAARFHDTVAQMISQMCKIISDKTGITQVVLSGGVFQNRLLLRKTVSLLEADGFEVFTHRQVPTNDGGISVGQVVIANFTSV